MSAPASPAVRITTFPLPTGVPALGTLICGGLMFFSSHRHWIFNPRSHIYRYILAGKAPDSTVVRAAMLIQDIIFYSFVVIHAIETVVFATRQLRKHGVPTFSLLWWKWVVTCFVGGQFTWMHFDGVVGETARREKKAR